MTGRNSDTGSSLGWPHERKVLPGETLQRPPVRGHPPSMGVRTIYRRVAGAQEWLGLVIGEVASQHNGDSESEHWRGCRCLVTTRLCLPSQWAAAVQWGPRRSAK